jgi:hypothetical protein
MAASLRGREPESSAMKTMTENTSLCVIVVITSCVFKSSINPITSPNPVYSHSITRQYYQEGYVIFFTSIDQGHPYVISGTSCPSDMGHRKQGLRFIWQQINWLKFRIRGMGESEVEVSL